MTPRWTVTFTATVGDAEYAGEVETSDAVMNDYIAREYAGHYLHVETDAPIDRLDVADIEVGWCRQ